MTDLIENIKAASNEQAEGIRQVNIAVSEMDRITQQNSLLVDESATTSKLMSDHAQELVKTIEVFKLDQIDYKPDLETQESQKLLEQPADYKNDPSKKDPKNNDDDLLILNEDASLKKSNFTQSKHRVSRTSRSGVAH